MAAKETPEKKRIALRLPTLSLENDISYRGPLSCRLFRFLGWICIVLSFAAVMMELALSVNAENETRLRGWISAIAYIADLSFPFLLIANFSVILNNTEGYRKQLVKNGAAMLGIALLFLLFFNKYLLGTSMAWSAPCRTKRRRKSSRWSAARRTTDSWLSTFLWTCSCAPLSCSS